LLTGTPGEYGWRIHSSIFENQGVKKLSALETPKGPKPIFTGAVVYVHAKYSNEQPLTPVAGEW
jgi:hypothetical protein